MTRRSKQTTVESLAKELFVDPDELVVMLWDLGLKTVRGAHSQIPARQADEVRTSLGFATVREQTRLDYWMRALNMTRDEFESVLTDLGFRVSRNTSRLPEGALRQLQKKYLDPNSPTLTQRPEPLTTESPHDATPLDTDPAAVSAPTPSPQPFVWQEIGQASTIVHMSTSEVLEIHTALVRDFARTPDPISPPGVRSQELLDSAVHRPRSTFDGTDKYTTVELAGAALLHSLVLNHAFHNGNKRTGLVSLLAFLDKNSLFPTCSQEDLFEVTLRLAGHALVPYTDHLLADREVQELAHWIKRSTRRTSRGERPLPWHRLLRILRSYDVVSDLSPSVGNRINLTREYSRRVGPLRRRHEIVKLKTQAQYRSAGSEVEKNTLHYIRRELHLDEEHGYDSQVFYEAEAEPDDFIQTYRTVLRRLARL